MVAGLILWRLNRFEEAAGILQRWPELVPASADLLVLKGMVLRQLPDQLPAAVKAFTTAVQLDPFRATVITIWLSYSQIRIISPQLSGLFDSACLCC